MTNSEARKRREHMAVVDGDVVNKPAHYTSHPKGIECFDVIEDNPHYLIGAAMKYLWRVSWGGKDNDVQDLRKAIAHLEREVQRRTRTT